MKTVIVYNNMLFASPRHLMNHFRLKEIHPEITIKYLTQCVYKRVSNPKGVHLRYLSYDLTQPMAKNTYDRIKSLTRSGNGYVMGAMTPLDYFNDIIAPLLKETDDPVSGAIDRALAKGIGTRKDYEELLKEAKSK